MSRHRSGTASPLSPPPFVSARPIRVIASGTLFLTHTLDLSGHPAPATSVRAHAYSRSRGGSASSVLSVLAQFRTVGVDGCWLVASLGGNADGRELIRELERAGVSTHYCRVWPHAGIPAAWVLHAADTGAQTVINHNPLPDITHEEFVTQLGPLLAPENYPPAPPAPPPLDPEFGSGSGSSTGSPISPRPSFSAGPATQPRGPGVLAPFDWLHFEGRSVKTTLSNIVGIDGLARERRWRAQCVFSVDVGRRARQGIEALIPHADVIFLNRHYAQTHSPAHARTPRAFLLSLSALAPPHALLVAYWGADGAAVLSVPTREYFQSSGWVDDTPPAATSPHAHLRPHFQHQHQSSFIPDNVAAADVGSVRSGSDFWAGRRTSATSSSAFFSAGAASSPSSSPSPRNDKGKGKSRARDDDDSDGDDSDADSQGTEIAGPGRAVQRTVIVDDAGAQDAFVAGMIYALSRRLLPGAPYSPGLTARAPADTHEGGRWRLDECLRFATELAGRKARRREWDGLGEEMARAGWFDG